ncbi:TetR/AcrR family transcriptional regulator C-terminal domain-containing protein [Actinomadura macrotermitis]|uniref:Tetracycline repressor protein n=1 Tax=Actinomadura macrotermitis TaxID=2585200 RepID=A0A7K0BMX1_9ACTN|nr:TetR/AcrR family transcriptional regulator C-terminal domain-containing protein [Actinomadura macrotermitis]MQY02054.1 Tetracycline repressor protein [Actinomadura macrotermitis]
MPRPRSLTQSQIAAAALAVVDDDGLAALSMRAVAKRLGTSTMALYRYVQDRHELEGLIVELVFAGVDPVPPAAGTWQERVAEMARRVRAAIGAHPEAVPLTMIHRHSSPGLLRWSEGVLEILAGAGVTGAARVVALRTLTAQIIGAVQLERLGPLAGRGTDAIAALSPQEFPLMAETAREARSVGDDRVFERGLAALLRGLGPS